MDGFERRLLAGVAELLAADGVALWRPDIGYADDEVGIVLGLPRPNPPSQIALLTYNADDDPVSADSTVSMQARIRGPGALVDDLADALFASLHGRRAVTVGGVRLRWARRVSALPLGADSSGRAERADNYDLAVHRPTPNRD